MSTRAVVSVSTTPHFARGQQRLIDALGYHGHCESLAFKTLPAGCPTHEQVPFAFKYHALQYWRDRYDTLIWADCSILPVRSFEPLWAHIEEHGAMIMNGGWSNYEWTADLAYSDLFANVPEKIGWPEKLPGIHDSSEQARAVNRDIKHVIGGFFGLSMKHPAGRAILDEMYRLAQTEAFRGPLWNSNAARQDYAGKLGAKPCGPPDVHGHRHDQTALSVVAWRNGVKLCEAPQWLVYGKAKAATDERTVVVADGNYA